MKIVIKTILDLYILIDMFILKQYIKILHFQNNCFTCILNSCDLTSQTTKKKHGLELLNHTVPIN